MANPAYSDVYSPQYLFCGRHVRRLATITSFTLLFLAVVAIPIKIYGQYTHDENEPKYAHQNVVGFAIAEVLAIAACICAIMADRTEKSVLYFPMIIFSILQIIFCVLFYLLVLTIIWVPDWSKNVDLGINNVMEKKELATKIFTTLFFTIIFGVLITVFGIIASIMMVARKYMKDEVESGNVRRNPEYKALHV